MIRQLSNHTCIGMSVELNLHLTTPFPAMNKKLPSYVVDTKCYEQSSKIGINRNHVDAELSSDDGDLPRIQQAANVGRVSDEFSSIAAQLLDTLQIAVMKRVTLIQDGLKYCGMYCKSEQKEHKLSHNVTYNQAWTWSNAKIAILFSGGVDSMVLAALADRQVVLHWLF